MAVYDLQEQEQLSELKAWWQQWGNFVTATIVAVAVTVVAWTLWNRYQQTQGSEASVIFSVLQKAATQKDAKSAREAAGEMIDKYPRTIYASMGALLSAKIQVEAGENKTAHVQLQWVIDKGADAELRDLARLRLAGLLFDEKRDDEALKLLTTEPLPAFVVRFEELKGDILAAKGQSADARLAYQKAIAKLNELNTESVGQQSGSVHHEFLQMKLDSLKAQ